ncbi:hypothetical protein JT318_gp04 [Pseudomonas phage PspYZU01]|uniref:Uncharacterized protein n=1 Tax=Pseudomonas phage PspYZU01 TaxID=1983555 RepID=A0A2U7NBI7_9CAUD|nr:hypothetical protein JT318_gp04 [Pseudomonas phage PspYZU01]ASD51889.1 hypothetical protein PspYZU01_04 [Pseudomonas phage PspYZU01]
MSAVRTAFSQAAHAASIAFAIQGAGTLAAKLSGFVELRDMYAEHLETMPVRYLGQTWVVSQAGAFVHWVNVPNGQMPVAVGLDEAKRLDEFAAKEFAKYLRGGPGKALSLGDALREEVRRLSALIAELSALLSK